MSPARCRSKDLRYTVSKRLSLVGAELVHIPYVTEGPAHFLHDLHVVECRLQRLGGGLHSIHRRVTGSLGSGSCLLAATPHRLPGFPQALLLLPDCLERLTML